MCTKNFRKRTLPEQAIYLYWPNFNEEVSHLTVWQKNIFFWIIWNKCKNIPGMSPKNFKNISSRTGDFEILANFNKEVSQLTDWQSESNYLEIVYRHPRNVVKKIWKIYNPEQEMTLYLSDFNKEVSKPTDWTYIFKNYLEMVYKYPRNFSK